MLAKEKESEREFIKQCIEESYTTPRDRVYNNHELLKAALEEAENAKDQFRDVSKIQNKHMIIIENSETGF